MAIAKAVASETSLAPGVAGLRIDCSVAMPTPSSRLSRLVSLYFALGIGYVFAPPDQLWADRPLCLSAHLFALPIQPEARITHNLTAAAGFTFVVYVIQRYVKQRESLTGPCGSSAINFSRRELAAQVQRMFLPSQPPSSGTRGQPG